MYIAQIGPQARAERARGRKPGRSEGAAFSDALGALPRGSDAAPAPVGGTGAAGVLLSIQEIGGIDDEGQKRQTVQWSENILDQLEQLRRDVLSGVLTPERLAALSASLNAQAGVTADPLLREIMEEIELRAEVELAKWDSRPATA